MLNLLIETGIDQLDSSVQNCMLSQFSMELEIGPRLDLDGKMAPSHVSYQSVTEAKAKIYEEESDEVIETLDLRVRFSDFNMISDPNGHGMRILAKYDVLSTAKSPHIDKA